jgi:hypothetical protein
MHPMFIVAIPLVLVIVGMVLNSIGLGFNQPPSSSEQDPEKRAAAEKEDYRRFFDLQRRQAVKRQTRVGQYAWLLMIAIIGSFIWLYMDTVNKTILENRVATLQTLPTEEGKEMVLSITLKDGSNVKYLIKTPPADALEAVKKEGMAKEKVSSYEMSQLGTALNFGENPLPLGVVVKIAN